MNLQDIKGIPTISHTCRVGLENGEQGEFANDGTPALSLKEFGEYAGRQYKEGFEKLDRAFSKLSGVLVDYTDWDVHVYNNGASIAIEVVCSVLKDEYLAYTEKHPVPDAEFAGDVEHSGNFWVSIVARLDAEGKFTEAERDAIRDAVTDSICGF